MIEEGQTKRPFKKAASVILIGLLSILNVVVIHQIFNSTLAETKEVIAIEEPEGEELFGFNSAQTNIVLSEVKENEFLSDILSAQGVPYVKIHNLVQNTSELFNVRQIRAGKRCAFICDDLCEAPSHFIYEDGRSSYFVFDIEESTCRKVERPVTTELAVASGVIDGSLWQSMEKSGMSWGLIEKMESALAWSLDFYHIQQGDEYKVFYEKKFVDGEPYGVGRLLGAYYKNYGNEYYAIYFENEKYQGFYDTEGRPTKRAFLKSPVKYSRISSGFSRKRFHPVLKRFKAHLGTDYAAPTGTPIYAVANGVVSRASYSRGNGKYVKIKHDKTYATQYLHMSRFAKGIRSGVHVKQGQVIGYVGQTGLATGPHVCFRFWKNGRQVNHRRLNFPPTDPLPEIQLDEFYCERDQIVDVLDRIEIDRNAKKFVSLEN